MDLVNNTFIYIRYSMSSEGDKICRYENINVSKNYRRKNLCNPTAFSETYKNTSVLQIFSYDNVTWTT